MRSSRRWLALLIGITLVGLSPVSGVKLPAVAESNRSSDWVPTHSSQAVPLHRPDALPQGGGEDYDNRLFSTFLGAGGHEHARAVAVDGSGAVYVTGETDSAEFPTTPGAFQPSHNGGTDGFVAKLDTSGSELLYATFLGGSGEDRGFGLAIEEDGAVYVLGYTESADFPATAGSFDVTYNQAGDLFVVKLNESGTALVYATFLGGGGWDRGYTLAGDGTGSVYLSGVTESNDFPTTPGTFDPTFNGGQRDAFAAKLNADGTGLVYSTFIGGSGQDSGHGIAVDGSGAAYLSGDTYSTDFPVTAGAYDTTLNGGRDLFVAKLNAAGTALTYATYLGGSQWEQAQDIAVDEGGAAWVTGSSRSSDFPTTPGAYDTTYNGNYDVIVTKLDPGGSQLIYSTFLGGDQIDGGVGLSTMGSAAIVVTGDTQSGGFPTTPDAFDTTFNGGGRDAFVTLLAPDTPELVYSTFLGGGGDGWGLSVSSGAPGTAYVSGITFSTDFPTTSDAYDPSFNGGFDGYVTCFRLGQAVPVQFVPDTPDGRVGEWHSFTGSFRDPDGWEDITSVQMILGRQVGDRRGLSVRYESNPGAFYLRDALAGGWLGPCLPGEPVVLSTGSFELDCGQSTVSQDGSAGLEVTWRARWIRPVRSQRPMIAFLRARDVSGNDSAFLQLGGWTLLPGKE